MADAAAVLARFTRGDVPANVALMQLVAETESRQALRALLDASAARADDPGRARLATLSGLLDANPGADALIRTVLATANHDPALSPKDGVAHWAAIFDRLAASQPEAAVALYALGSGKLLADATDEVVARMREWRLLGATRSLVEIGCGIGRLSLALAPLMASVTGLDVSAGMIVEARRRGGTCPNALFRQNSGRDLDGVPDASCDVVLAADVFPYLVAAGGDVAARHVAESARILRPGGALLILNYSYRGDLAADRAEMAALFGRSDLSPERDGTRDFEFWDGATFLGWRR